MHSFRRVGSTWNSAVIDTGPSLGAGNRLGSRLWAKIETGADSKLRLLVKSIEICRAGTTRTRTIINMPNTAAPETWERLQHYALPIPRLSHQEQSRPAIP